MSVLVWIGFSGEGGMARRGKRRERRKQLEKRREAEIQQLLGAYPSH
jgi:ribonuclease PH